MTQINAASQVYTAPKASVFETTPAAQPVKPEVQVMEVAGAEKSHEAPTDPMARVVMDAAAAYDASNQQSATGGSDFDRLALVLDGFAHMRNIIAMQKSDSEFSMSMTF